MARSAVSTLPPRLERGELRGEAAVGFEVFRLRPGIGPSRVHQLGASLQHIGTTEDLLGIAPLHQPTVLFELEPLRQPPTAIHEGGRVLGSDGSAPLHDERRADLIERRKATSVHRLEPQPAEPHVPHRAAVGL
jgi:hypothetical protein